MMASPRRTVPRRTRIFIGCEGDCEIAFVTWLQKLCDARGLYTHLDRGPGAAGGGDTLAIVETCRDVRSRGRQKGAYARSLIILDRDRLAGDGERGRRAIATAQREGFLLVFSKPNIEGLLLRLFEGHEQDNPQAGRALDALRHVWPEYRKPPIAVELERHFTVDDLRRAARFDEDLAALLRAVGIR
jgi:hypothetical protein